MNFLQAVLAKRGTCINRQMAGGAVAAVATSHVNKAFSIATSPVPSAAHVCVTFKGYMHHNDDIKKSHGRNMGSETAVQEPMSGGRTWPQV